SRSQTCRRVRGDILAVKRLRQLSSVAPGERFLRIRRGRLDVMSESALQRARAVDDGDLLTAHTLRHHQRGDDDYARHQNGEEDGHEDEHLLPDGLQVLALDDREHLVHRLASRVMVSAPTCSIKISSSDGAASSNLRMRSRPMV